MKFIFAIVTTAILAVSPAIEADDVGFYLGAGVGSMGVDVEEAGVDFGGDDTSFKVFGGYNFNRYFGGELEYIDGGSAEDTYDLGEGDILKVAVDVSGFNASLVGRYPFAEDRFDVFAKVGMIFWDADFEASAFGDTAQESDSGEDFSWGVGASWYFLENLGARVEYQGFEVEDTDTVDLISASVVWRF